MDKTEFMNTYLHILEQHKLPFVEVDASQGQVFVPREFISEDGSIYLNISPEAIRDLKIVDGIFHCRATFKSEVFSLSFPLTNIIEIVAEDEDA